ncbi:ABC transporter ATP-binding protein [bacterium]|nr:ABC transporter ATP-binding protein [bacterium]
MRTYFDTDDGVVKAVDGVDLTIRRGETLGIVGESGCGKSVTAFSIMQLLPKPQGRVAGGEIFFHRRDGTVIDIANASDPEMRKIRGNKISMIFQEPMTSLNPVFTVGDQIGEAIVLHQGKTKREARQMSIAILEKVGIPSPQLRIDNYPHEMSGGMKQRVMIAMALVCKPDLLIADEPTTALDVTIQAQILDLLRQLQEEIGMSIWFITHDLGVIAEIAHEVAVMYASKVVERAPVETLFTRPRHPYTRGLFKSLPHTSQGKERLEAIQGVVPNPLDFPSGCKFHTRCPHVIDDCKKVEPGLVEIEPGHWISCSRVERGEIA